MFRPLNSAKLYQYFRLQMVEAITSGESKTMEVCHVPVEGWLIWKSPSLEAPNLRVDSRRQREKATLATISVGSVKRS